MCFYWQHPIKFKIQVIWFGITGRFFSWIFLNVELRINHKHRIAPRAEKGKKVDRQRPGVQQWKTSWTRWDWHGMKRNVPPKTEKNGSYELRPHAPQGVKEKNKKKRIASSFLYRNTEKKHRLRHRHRKTEFFSMSHRVTHRNTEFFSVSPIISHVALCLLLRF